MSLKIKKTSILSQLKGVFILGVSFLIISLFFFQSFNSKTINGIADAYNLDGGIITIVRIQDSINQIGKTLSAANQAKEVKDLYKKQLSDTNTAIDHLIKDLKRFESGEKHLIDSQNSIKEIDQISKRIFAENSGSNVFSSNLLGVNQHQIEAHESLSKAAIEYRSLLNKTYTDIQSKKNKPFLLGLLLTLLLAFLLSLLSSFIFRRIRLFITDHLSATNKISNGDLETRVSVNKHDELGKISHEFNKMVEKLQITKDELERSNQDLEDFAYTASHDLQTPLRHITAFSELIANSKDSASQEDLNKWAQNIRLSTDSIIHLIDDLLRFSKIGKEELKKEKASMDDLLKQVIIQSKEVYPDLSVQQEALPNLECYKSLLHLVFQNLIDNAVKYCPSDRKPVVSIYCTESSEDVQFFVGDNGCGVPENQKERIFGLFRRLHSAEQIKGSGAGLAICKKIIERHEGRIWVEDNKDSGALFCFTIPKKV